MTWNDALADDEQLHWEARPAPRCYVFRQWRQALFGLVFLLLCLVWQVWGLAVARAHDAGWAAWLPLPFVLLGLKLSVGRIIAARLEWPRVAYAITDRRLLVRSGSLGKGLASMELTEVTYFRLHFHGEELGTLRVHQGQERSLTLYCIEYPRRATMLLEAAMGEQVPLEPAVTAE